MRLFFATDVHGSDRCWRKFLRAGEFYEADAIVLGGDMTGKGIVPIVGQGSDRYSFRLHDRVVECDSAALEHWQREIATKGLYGVVVDEEEYRRLSDDPDAFDKLFLDLVLKRVEEWIALAEEALKDSKVRCFVCPGNDDAFEIDEVLKSSSRLEMGESRSIPVEGFEILGTGWSNPTPWLTHREESEGDLVARFRRMLDTVSAPPERLIFNFHCPPHGTPLDEAPALSDDLRVLSAGRVLSHVGSTAVRETIEEVQPILSLHGHIHESRASTRLGRTLAINPGSVYELGTLQGALVDLNGKKKVSRYGLTIG
jgi:Icc-related predicted phosphoesterase